MSLSCYRDLFTPKVSFSPTRGWKNSLTWNILTKALPLLCWQHLEQHAETLGVVNQRIHHQFIPVTRCLIFRHENFLIALKYRRRFVEELGAKKCENKNYQLENDKVAFGGWRLTAESFLIVPSCSLWQLMDKNVILAAVECWPYSSFKNGLRFRKIRALIY